MNIISDNWILNTLSIWQLSLNLTEHIFGAKLFQREVKLHLLINTRGRVAWRSEVPYSRGEQWAQTGRAWGRRGRAGKCREREQGQGGALQRLFTLPNRVTGGNWNIMRVPSRSRAVETKCICVIEAFGSHWRELLLNITLCRGTRCYTMIKQQAAGANIQALLFGCPKLHRWQSELGFSQLLLPKFLPFFSHLSSTFPLISCPINFSPIFILRRSSIAAPQSTLSQPSFLSFCTRFANVNLHIYVLQAL